MDARNMWCLFELLESSSSSSDDEALLTLLQRSKKPKLYNYIADCVSKYSDVEFKKNFRMERRTCYQLIKDFEGSRHYPSNTHGGRKRITSECHILSFLWYAGNKCCIRDVASRFGMAESTFLSGVMERVMAFLLEIAPSIIKFPSTHEEKIKLADEFKKLSGFPDVLGCIDGTYLPIRTPAHKVKSTYINRHDGTSLTLQGICDPKRRFIDVFTGPPSKVHDARIFEMSDIRKDIADICGSTFHILGDAAYPLREYLLTPFRDYGNLTAAKRNYNFKFCGTRVIIENTFGLFKQRFRQFVRTDFYGVNKTTKFIISCCVLHNLCIDQEDLWDEGNVQVDEEITNNPADVSDNLRRALGEIKRQAICDQLQ